LNYLTSIFSAFLVVKKSINLLVLLISKMELIVR